MFSRVSIASFTVGAFLLGLMAQGVTTLPVHAGGVPAPQVLKVDQMTRRQFREQLKTLPDATVIELRGERTTAGEIRAKMRLPADVATTRAQAVAAQLKANTSQATARFEGRRTQFLQQQQAKLQADNAKAMAELALLRQEAAIQQEAAQLLQRSKTASPQERAQIQQRASQLLQQLQQMGR